MKQALLLSVLGLGLLSSCATAFKTGQTPDDVYYSPGRELVSTREDETQRKQQQESYQQYQTNLEDEYLRMKISRRYRWDVLDDFSYWNDSRYDYGTYNNYNSYSGLYPKTGLYANWNYGYNNYYPYNGYNGWNSPAYTIINYNGPKLGSTGTNSATNINAYRNPSYNNNNYGYKDPKTGNFIPSNNNNSFGNLLKKVFTGSDGSSNTSYDRPVRSFPTTNTPSNTPSTTPSSSAGGSSGGFPSTGSSSSTGRGGRGG